MATLQGTNGPDEIEATFSDDSITGGRGNDFIDGSGGDDTLRGEEGNDTVWGGVVGGGDTGERNLLDGGAGNDILVASPYSDAGEDRFVFEASHGDDLVLGNFGAPEDDTSVQYGDNEKIDLSGFGDRAPTWSQIEARLTEVTATFSHPNPSVDDRSAPSTRLDLSDFGGGSITFFDTARQYIDESDFLGLADAPEPTDPESLNGDAGDNFLAGTAGGDNINGRGGRDFIDSKQGDDSVDAGSGNDFVLARAGNDTVRGGDGSDWIEGGSGADSLYGGANGGAPDIVAGQAGNDQLYGEAGNDRLWGGGGNDTLYGGDDSDGALDGGTGNDRIYGGAGDDFLNGGAGSDTLTGGASADTFRFNAYQTNRADRDVVTDYSEGDLVQLNMRGVLHTTAAEHGGFTLDDGVLTGHGFHITLQGPGVGSLELEDIAIV